MALLVDGLDQLSLHGCTGELLVPTEDQTESIATCPEVELFWGLGGWFWGVILIDHLTGLAERSITASPIAIKYRQSILSKDWPTARRTGHNERVWSVSLVSHRCLSAVVRLMIGGTRPDYLRLLLLSKMTISVFGLCATSSKPELVSMKHSISEQAEQPQVMVLHGRSPLSRIHKLLFSQRPLEVRLK